MFNMKILSVILSKSMMQYASGAITIVLTVHACTSCNVF